MTATSHTASLAPSPLRHLTGVIDLSDAEVQRLLERTSELKRARAERHFELLLQGRTVALLFEKPSMRTRVSFQAAVAQLGGSSLFLDGNDVRLGVRESVRDFARVISRYVDVLVARTFKHELVLELARHATVPVINGLSDLAHPCQALADLFTVREHFGDLRGRSLVFVGDGNNVARSLAVACARTGVRFVLAAPEGYTFDAPFLLRYAEAFGGAAPEQTHDPQAAVRAADAIYTDVWASMGQEHEGAERRRVFAPYQVNADLLARAAPHAVLMHCLPAHREEEVSADAIDGPQSIVIDQAENRLHLQKALLVWLLRE